MEIGQVPAEEPNQLANRPTNSEGGLQLWGWGKETWGLKWPWKQETEPI